MAALLPLAAASRSRCPELEYYRTLQNIAVQPGAQVRFPSKRLTKLVGDTVLVGNERPAADTKTWEELTLLISAFHLEEGVELHIQIYDKLHKCQSTKHVHKRVYKHVFVVFARRCMQLRLQ